MNPMRLSRECLMDGCSLAKASAELELCQQLLTEAQAEKRQAMSGALWCDLGEHAFSSRDKKRTTYRVSTFDDDGAPVEDDRVACGQHAVSFAARVNSAPALPKGADPELYTEFLEWKAGQREAAPAVDEHG